MCSKLIQNRTNASYYSSFLLLYTDYSVYFSRVTSSCDFLSIALIEKFSKIIKNCAQFSVLQQTQLYSNVLRWQYLFFLVHECGTTNKYCHKKRETDQCTTYSSHVYVGSLFLRNQISQFNKLDDTLEIFCLIVSNCSNLTIVHLHSQLVYVVYVIFQIVHCFDIIAITHYSTMYSIVLLLVGQHLFYKFSENYSTKLSFFNIFTICFN